MYMLIQLFNGIKNEEKKEERRENGGVRNDIEGKKAKRKN